MGIPFEVDVAHIPERRLPGEMPEAFVRRISLDKALAIAEGVERHGPLIIAADTIVVLEGDVLGKPADAREATEMLRRLRGRRHTVYTGLAFVWRAMGLQSSELAATLVHMASYDEVSIARYVSTGDPFDKAGAYAIQSEAFAPVARVEGCYANVMGMPMCHLYCRLAEHGLTPPVHPLDVCPLSVSQGCPWSREIITAGAGCNRGGRTPAGW